MQPINGSRLLDGTSDEAQITHDSNVTEPLTNRTLYINNLGRSPRNPSKNLTLDYADFATGSSLMWLIPAERPLWDVMRNEQSHNFTEDVIIDELHVYGGGQVAFLDPATPSSSLQIRLGSVKGEKLFYTAEFQSSDHNVTTHPDSC